MLLVANPSASGFTGAGFRRVVEILERRWQITPVWPLGPRETRTEAATAESRGFDIVVAMGGDGVVHHVGNGLIHSATPMGVLPAGTTNVFARLLGFPTHADKAAELLIEGSPRPIAVARLATDLETDVRSTFALFSLGIGFDADVVAVAETRPHSKLHFGSVHYARTALGRVFGPYRRRPANLRIDCDGHRVDGVAALVQVHDAYTYLGRLPLSLSGATAEGLTAAAFESITVTRVLNAAGRMAIRRNVDTVSGIHVWSDFGKIVVDAEPAAAFQADGELLGVTGTLEVTWVGGALQAMAPR